MNEAEAFALAVTLWCGLGAAVLPLLFFITAPYGRFPGRVGGPPCPPGSPGW